MAKPKYTIADFNRDYPNEDACLEVVLNMVYPEGILCRKCGIVRPHSKLTGRKAYSCNYCGTHVYPLAGTIFEKSTTPLKSWFYAMYLISTTRCGISAKQLERELGVTYKTAWRMFTQIRKLMEEDGGPLAGFVEVDETFVGGDPRYQHGQRPKNPDGSGKKGRRPADHPNQKITVLGAVERGGKVRAAVAPDRKTTTVLPLVTQHIMPHATVFTDEAPVYKRLKKQGYEHHRINHSAKVYVEGNVHTNTIEGFWSLLKNGIRGAHHAVGAGYLQSYVNEYTFRYNHRDDAEPMYKAIGGRVNKTRHGRYGQYAPVGE